MGQELRSAPLGHPGSECLRRLQSRYWAVVIWRLDWCWRITSRRAPSRGCQVSAGVGGRLQSHHVDLCLSVLMMCSWVLPDEGSQKRVKWKSQCLLGSSLRGQNVSCLRYFRGDPSELSSVWKGATQGYGYQVRIIMETGSHTWKTTKHTCPCVIKYYMINTSKVQFWEARLRIHT